MRNKEDIEDVWACIKKRIIIMLWCGGLNKKPVASDKSEQVIHIHVDF